MKLSNYRKAQIRLGETIAVLVIFFFLLVFGAAFYLNFQKSSVRANQEEMYIKDSIDVSQIVSFLPELQCSRENIIDDNCYDIFKVESATKIINQSAEYYFPLFLYSDIIISQVYPIKKEWQLYNRELTKSAPIYTYIPISLFHPVTKQYSFGVLTIGYYPFYGDE